MMVVVVGWVTVISKSSSWYGIDEAEQGVGGGEDVIRGSEMWSMSAGGGAGLEVMERRSNIDRAGVKEDKVKFSQVEVKDGDDWSEAWLRMASAV